MKHSKQYYTIAKLASSQIGNHEGLKQLKALAAKASKILDLGCGEGTRLNLMANKPAWGIDIDAGAIKQAKKQYSKHNFRRYDGQTLPYEDNQFDLVYSAFVLEHTQDPKEFLLEAIRVTKKGGKLILLCPNFGAPNRRSPNSTESPLSKLWRGLKADFIASDPTELNWKKVRPNKTYEQIDDDTTVEPYLETLVSYLRACNLEIKQSSSLWQLEPLSLNPRKLLFLLLGRLGVYPFSGWGPQIFILAQKN
jgi:ubiquinone/menaquinone biosynthesis C-methylase UbiE